MYGEPFKPKDQERAIPLGPQDKVTESRKPPADNLRPNREFPTTRHSPRRPRDPSDRAARALFEVQGRTPLHVRAAAFDAFDGVAWREAPLHLPGGPVEREPHSCWMRAQGPAPAAAGGGVEAHQFKITGPVGALVPTPPHLTRFRVGRVDRADFFAWGQDRIVRLAQRKQCTPDLLPGDITGFSVFNQKTREFDFLPGPVFADVLLADEINRTTPRTQSALLEAMAERQVTVDNVRHALAPGFFVIAT
jgi:hypothetical protein